MKTTIPTGLNQISYALHWLNSCSHMTNVHNVANLHTGLIAGISTFSSIFEIKTVLN